MWNRLIQKKTKDDPNPVLQKLLKSIKRSNEELDRCMTDLEKRQVEYDTALEKARQAAARVRGENRSLETALEEARTKSDLIQEHTVAGLVQANRLLLARWEAQTAIEVMRRTAVNTKPSEDGL